MISKSDGLTAQDWDGVRRWARKLAKAPVDESLLCEFEAWVLEKPLRAEAVRKFERMERLIPALHKDYLDGMGDKSGANTRRKLD